MMWVDRRRISDIRPVRSSSIRGVCKNRQCLFPKPCRNLNADHSDYLKLLPECSASPGVKKVFIRSGIRFDYLLAEQGQTFLKELCEHHVSGQTEGLRRTCVGSGS